MRSEQAYIAEWRHLSSSARKCDTLSVGRHKALELFEPIHYDLQLRNGTIPDCKAEEIGIAELLTITPLLGFAIGIGSAALYYRGKKKLGPD